MGCCRERGGGNQAGDGGTGSGEGALTEAQARELYLR